MRWTRWLIAAVVVASSSTVASTTPATASPSDFVTRQGSQFTLNGEPFRYAGTNNYYLMYRSPAMVDDVFARAKAAKLSVIRTWGSLDIGNQDGTNSIHHKEDGVYFQYWDGAQPAYNDGADGLEHLDYVLWKARQSGIKLIIPFINNWSAFGGIDQYVRWSGGTYHDDFYTNPTIKKWYADWVGHLLNRVNTLTGIKYKDDPTVMAWELANEPRCKGSGNYPTSPTCSTTTLNTWVAEMSKHVKSIDRRHMVSVGDEGFYCSASGTDFTDDCSEGVDTLAYASIPTIDYLSLHLYPDHWTKDTAWGTKWITRHTSDARRLGKPVVLGEFGILDKTTRNPAYRAWLDAFILGGGDGFNYWMIAGTQDDGTLYPDYDGFTVYCPSPVCQTITNAGAMIRGKLPLFPPVADDDTAITTFDTPITVGVTTNDIAYLAKVRADSIDLDPDQPGRQTTRVTGSGTFSAASGKITFSPVAGFSGRIDTKYTVRDTLLRVSNAATLSIVVKPDPGAAIVIASFENGVQGWASASWQTDAGTVVASDQHATAGTGSLRVDATGGGWFGTALPEPLDLSTKGSVKFDLGSTTTGTSTNIAFQTGPDFTWCQSTWGYQNPETTGTVEADLLSGLSCSTQDLTDVRGIYVWAGSGTFYIDNVRAE